MVRGRHVEQGLVAIVVGLEKTSGVPFVVPGTVAGVLGVVTGVVEVPEGGVTLEAIVKPPGHVGHGTIGGKTGISVVALLKKPGTAGG